MTSQAPGTPVPRAPEIVRVNAPRSFWGGVRTDAKDIWQFRGLLVNLIRKELKVKYKDSVLGFLWTLARPLLQLLVYSIAIGYFLGAGRDIPQFGIYLFVGLLAWGFFSDIIGGCTASIVGNAGLIKKVYFPREIIPLSLVGAAAINVALQSLVLVAAYLYTWSWPAWRDIALLPLALLVVVVFGSALGLLLAAGNVYLRDIQYLVEVGMLLWFWLTPVIYAWTKARDAFAQSGLDMLFDVYMLNPMANVVLAVQRAMWPAAQTERGQAFVYDGRLYERLGLLLVASMVLLWLAQRIFARVQGNFAQEL